ncbi:MAG: DNA mismatch repair protein MutL [Firmicutes bacterium ADurb.Bin080]|nr:DNA mismatch repair endonuclease MutL [Clostridiales bacterium]OQC16453.1 MAG: DNA mismatch repair protein MutL [Firmicutes bacterium ADurb.Bin080]
MIINILDSTVYNRISAGEVIENPSSVVKELLDNCIDAGATSISIKTKDGGLSYIEISDNGSGIPKSELSKTILPHATSKLNKAEDLFYISTLGFRGEALASISEVSDFEIRTRNNKDTNGCFLHKINDTYIVEDYPKESGTTVLVKNLFFNTPARYKFLGTKASEENNIKKILTQYILANPNISFIWETENGYIFRSNGQGLNESIVTVYGNNIFDKLIPIEDTEGKIKISGYISSPEIYKNNRNFQTIIINGRCISEIGISGVLNNLYSKYLMKHCFPIVILNILIPFEEVDVNVHPTKKEVRLSNTKQVYGKLYNTLNYFLERHLEDKQKASLNSFLNIESTQFTPISSEQHKPSMIDYQDDIDISKETISLSSSQVSLEDLPIVEKNALFSSDLINNNCIVSDQENILVDNSTYNNISNNKLLTNIDKKYTILGQIFSTYIVVSNLESVFFIDQHALHERILYDNYLADLKNNSVNSQYLLIPEIINCSYEQKKNIISISAILAYYGFIIEDFGQLSFRVIAVPSSLKDYLNLSNLFEQLYEFNFYNKKIDAIDSLLSERFALLACKAAVKAGDKFSYEQLNYLVEYFFKEGLPSKCPHGRPSYISFSKIDLEKLFKRKL